MAYLKFSIPSFRRGEVVQHQSRTFYRNWLKMFTNHRPPRPAREAGTLLALKVAQSASVWCLMVIMHHWPLSPGLIVPDHDAVPDVESWLTPPSFLVAGLCCALLPWLALAAARTLGFVTRLKTQQFLRELYRNNIYTCWDGIRYYHLDVFVFKLRSIIILILLPVNYMDLNNNNPISTFQKSTLVPWCCCYAGTRWDIP